MKTNICRYCYKPIKDKDQLVTASNWTRIKSFHYLCFQELEKETSSQRKLWTELNSPSANIRTIILLLFASWMLITNTLNHIGDFLGILALYPVLLRLASFLVYEITFPTKHGNK